MTGNLILINTDLRRELNYREVGVVIQSLCFIPEQV
jgi:hypothetical protein